ncbi:E2F-associated phosphoprotein-like [Watersipora subatra]|uniref:E2F-associated phosphoprotein-like n=1 Tax=Watersipora subatra TaxID=2589382 RepID=UPI00355C7E5F
MAALLASDLQDDTDSEGGEDSDDEVGQQRNHVKRGSFGPSDSVEDEFEKEMMSELESQMGANYSFSQYSENWREQGGIHTKATENDELFYDSKMDDDDERWVKKQREVCKGISAGSTDDSSISGKKSNEAKTDAVLNCPACMCTVCLDCQKHAVYDHQYRAMFTMNTMVNYGETLQYKKNRIPKNKRKRKLGGGITSVNHDPSGFADLVSVDPAAAVNEEVDSYHPVNCSNCKTRLAVYDANEVYHFFNVLSSYG